MLTAYLMVVQPLLQDGLQLSDNLVAVLLDTLEGRHVLVVGQHCLCLAVIPGKGEETLWQASMGIICSCQFPDSPNCLAIGLHLDAGLETRWKLKQELQLH